MRFKVNIGKTNLFTLNGYTPTAKYYTKSWAKKPSDDTLRQIRNRWDRRYGKCLQWETIDKTKDE